MVIEAAITQSRIKSAEEILERFRSKPIDADWSFIQAKPSDTGKWTHDYHRYPAKFIPQLVERLFDEYLPSHAAHVNDPFMGCGTTIVSAIVRGFVASGTDVNRVAFLITKVKATPIDPAYLAQKSDAFLSALNQNIEPLIPQNHIGRIKYWFSDDAANDLGRILRVIQQEDDPAIRNFFLVAFSHILKTCSIWLQGSTKPTRDLNKKSAKPLDAMRRHLHKMQRGNEAFYRVVPPQTRECLNEYLQIKIGDARKQAAPDASVDLIVSSSPYVTSYEYADLHQLSTIWLDFADDLSEYRKAFIGTSYKSSDDYKPRSQIARDIVQQMAHASEKMAREVETYFVDMEQVFDESYRILKPGGRCCYVIGNTQLKGVDILNAEAFADSLQHAGFALDRIIKREIPSKILPQKRDKKTGRFASNKDANAEAYPVEYIVIGRKVSI
jgi:DNA modification methylase